MAKILLVDDDPQVRRFVQRVLERRGGHAVTEVENGREAIRSLEAETFDMVVSDVYMPEMDGLEAIKELRRIRPGIRIVSISGGFHGVGMLAVAQALGADRVLAKPFTAEELLEAVSAVMAN